MAEKKKKRKRASFSLPKKDQKDTGKDTARAPQDAENTAKPDETDTQEKDADKQASVMIVAQEEEKKESAPTGDQAEEPSSQSDTSETAAPEQHDHPSQDTTEETDDTQTDDKKLTVGEFAPLDGRDASDVEQLDKTSKRNIALLVVIAVVSFILGFAVAFGVGTLLQGQSGAAPTPTPTPTVTSTPSPIPSPTAIVERAEVTLEVLNGSGVSGAAAGAQEFLEDLGYTVDAVGNANRNDYTESVLVVAQDLDAAIVERLVADLSEEYTVGDTLTDLEDDAGVTARFIVGRE